MSFLLKIIKWGVLGLLAFAGYAVVLGLLVYEGLNGISEGEGASGGIDLWHGAMLLLAMGWLIVGVALKISLFKAAALDLAGPVSRDYQAQLGHGRFVVDKVTELSPAKVVDPHYEARKWFEEERAIRGTPEEAPYSIGEIRELSSLAGFARRLGSMLTVEPRISAEQAAPSRQEAEQARPEAAIAGAVLTAAAVSIWSSNRQHRLDREQARDSERAEERRWNETRRQREIETMRQRQLDQEAAQRRQFENLRRDTAARVRRSAEEDQRDREDQRWFNEHCSLKGMKDRSRH